MNIIDMGYFENLALAAKEAIEKYGSFEGFIDESEDQSLILRRSRLNVKKVTI